MTFNLYDHKLLTAARTLQSSLLRYLSAAVSSFILTNFVLVDVGL